MEEVAARDLATWGRARAQTVLKRFDLAVRAFQAVLERLPNGRRVTEDLVFSAQYLDPPTGFEMAIKYGEPVVKKSAQLLAQLAAANGQKYTWLTAHGGDAAALADTKRKALEFAKAAIGKDAATWKPILRGLLDPDPGAEDDDLVGFQNDGEFRTLVA